MNLNLQISNTVHKNRDLNIFICIGRFLCDKLHDATVTGGIPIDQTPQIVLLTFDDAVNDLNKPLYSDLFENGRKNPNGCPISATFYVSHEWTDYSQVQNLYADGHEMASHTVS